MAIAPSFSTGLLGYDPLEQQRQQQKLWAGMYGQASSPYEKIGMGVGQLGAALIGGLMGDSPQQKKEKVVADIKQQADSQFVPGSPEYFRFVAENLPAEYADSRAYAAQEAAKADAAAQKMYLDRVKTVTENPQQMDIVSAPLSTQLQGQISRMSAGGQPLTEEQITKLQASPQFQQLIGLTSAKQVGMEKQAPATSALVDKELFNQAVEDSNGDIRKGAILYNERKEQARQKVAAAGVPLTPGTVKTSDISTFTSTVERQTKPARDKLTNYNELRNFVDLARRGNTEAVNQISRWLVRMSGDSQIGQNEVRQIANAGGFVERNVGGVQQFITGLPTKEKLDKINQLVDSLEDRTGQDLNKKLDKLTKVWSTSELPSETVQLELGERYVTAAERKRRAVEAAKNAPPAAGEISVTPRQQGLLTKYKQPTR